jgi:hypothetical protein
MQFLVAFSKNQNMNGLRKNRKSNGQKTCVINLTKAGENPKKNLVMEVERQHLPAWAPLAGGASAAAP